MLLTTAEKQQYNRHLILSEVGIAGQQKLKEAKVLVIGAGGLGCPILQYLAAAGVGKIGIVDDDKVDVSNLQRQILYGHSSIGINKAIAAKERLNDINPHIEINTYAYRLTSKNAVSLFSKYDIIIDGSDNFPTRYLCNDAAVLAEKPLVFGSIYKFEGQVSVFNYQNGPTYRCLFPNPPGPNEVPNCSEVGVLGILPGIIGAIQGNEVLKIVLETGEALSGKLLTYNTLNNSQIVLNFDKTEASNITELLDNYGSFCGILENDFQLEFSTVKENLEDYILVDVREEWERETFHIGGIHISLYELTNNLELLSTNKPLLLYCETGSRSEMGRKLLLNLLPNTDIFTIIDGVNSIEKSW
ncbi:MAG: molybdopterin-synthase adenylyltransferase MoeB [Crocinitomicaceae bacterium]